MKAKRIVSFCSLFSLVLILSVYYVLSPVSIDNSEVVNTEVENDTIVELVDGESAYFENLEVLKESALLDDIKELEGIIASVSATSQEKINALEVKAEKIKMNEKEKTLANMIKQQGYEKVYVEYEGDKVNILVGKKDSSKSDALTIIRSIYSSLNGYTPVVSFKA